MISLTLKQIASIVEGTLIGDDCTINSVNTDTRKIAKGDLFIALKGPNFDANKFTDVAANAGAAAAIVSESRDINIAQILVDDTRVALGLLGAHVKAHVSPKTIAITGSSGKTTVKEMVAAIMRRKGKVLATKGNFNNDIGVPLTLLRLEQDDEIAVIELGANHQGEIAYTTSLVQPDIALINNVAAAHLEGFGDLVGVARAKGEIFSGLTSGSPAVYNQDIEYAHLWERRLADKLVITFGCGDKGEFHCRNVKFDLNGCGRFELITPFGECPIQLPIPGKHNVCNAVAAAVLTTQMGATLEDVTAGLAAMEVAKGRMNLDMVTEKVRLIDDTYNANVQSTNAAVELLAEYGGKRVLVLGDMAELGQQARQFHEEVGEFASAKNIDELLTLGVLSQSASEVFTGNSQHYSNRDSLVVQLMEYITSCEDTVTVLFKGSRSAKMELVVQAVKAQLTEEKSQC